MKDRIERLELKFDKMDEKLDKNSVILAENAKDIENHIKRTDTLQDMIARHDKLYTITMFIVGATPVVLGIIYTLEKLSS